MKNLLFIHETSFISKIVYEYQALPELLSLKGHNVYVLDYEDKWQGLGISDYQELKVKRAYHEITLIRPFFIKFPIISRISAFISHYFTIKRVLKDKKIDAIILYSVPTNGLQALYWAKKFKIPVIFRSIDVLHKLVHNPILSLITKQLEKHVYKQSDLILTITPKLSEYIKKLGAKPDKIKYLALGVDTQIYKPELPDHDLKTKWGIRNGDKVIVFVGTLPNFSGLDRFLHEMPEILREYPNTKFLIVGDGIQKYKLQNIISALNLSNNVIITGYQPYELVPKFINLADVCISTFPNSKTTDNILPTKVLQYLSCGKPIASTPLCGTKSVIQGFAQGIAYAQDYEFSGMIDWLFKNNDLRVRMGENALKYIKGNHDYEKIILQLEAIIENHADKPEAQNLVAKRLPAVRSNIHSIHT